jgi:hypothetical protein
MTTSLELTDSEIELAQLRGALEEWRIYLAGQCTAECVAHGQIGSTSEPYNGHRHWTEDYEANRSTVVALTYLLAGEYDYASTLRRIGEQGP